MLTLYDGSQQEDKRFIFDKKNGKQDPSSSGAVFSGGKVFLGDRVTFLAFLPGRGLDAKKISKPAPYFF